MKDIFDEEGNLNDINYFYITQKKNNIVYEYSMLRTCFKNIWIDLIVHMQNTSMYNIMPGLSVKMAMVEI